MVIQLESTCVLNNKDLGIRNESEDYFNNYFFICVNILYTCLL